METYLVERYLPGIGRDGLRALTERLGAASADLRARGVAVNYLGSLYLPQEESCFCRFEASSANAAVHVNELAEAPFARISLALALGGVGD